jgi:hypothetical protein
MIPWGTVIDLGVKLILFLFDLGVKNKAKRDALSKKFLSFLYDQNPEIVKSTTLRDEYKKMLADIDEEKRHKKTPVG